MVSPSKTKFSRVANQKKTTSTSKDDKVKLVKGSRPLVHHRFYLDIERHQTATKIEKKIKELGGSIEFFLSKDITHFITDKPYAKQPAVDRQTVGGQSGFPQQYLPPQSPVTPTGGGTPRSGLSCSQYVGNEYGPVASCTSSPCPTPSSVASSASATPQGTAAAGREGKAKPAQPQSRADAMLQRVRQQQQHQATGTAISIGPGGSTGGGGTGSGILVGGVGFGSRRHSQFSAALNGGDPQSPCSPLPATVVQQQQQQQQYHSNQSPVLLAKSWGTPIWSAEEAFKFLKKVFETSKTENNKQQHHHHHHHHHQQQQQQQQQHPHQQHHHHHHHHRWHSRGGSSSAHVHHLRGDFLKVESLQRHYRPFYQEFKRWPVLHLDGKGNHSPFDSEREQQQQQLPSKAAATAKAAPVATTATAAAAVVTNDDKPLVDRMTRKVVARGKSDDGSDSINGTTKATTTATAAAAAAAAAGALPATNPATTAATTATTKHQHQRECGYCEICRIEYDCLEEHLLTDGHCAFVKNDSNFLALDRLISSGGASLEAFLKLNEQQCDDVVKEEEAALLGCDIGSKCRNATGGGGAVVVPVDDDRVVASERRKQGADGFPVVTSDGATVNSSPARGRGRKRGRPPLDRRGGVHRRPSECGGVQGKTVSVEDYSVGGEPRSEQMFGRRSAIHHHPHNTLNHHNHQKHKTLVSLLKQHQQKVKEQQQDPVVAVAAGTVEKQQLPVVSDTRPSVIKACDAEMKVISDFRSDKPTASAAAAVSVATVASSVVSSGITGAGRKRATGIMGLKGSTIKHTEPELIDCDGLDPKNTKRISLGLRQNPKRANLNEDFTSLLDETLERAPRKPRIRREGAKKVNYSEPKEDEALEEDVELVSLVTEPLTQPSQPLASEKEKQTKEKRCEHKKSSSASSALDIKVRGIRWRAPSPASRPPMKSPLLYKVIEQESPKATAPRIPKSTRLVASPLKDSGAANATSGGGVMGHASPGPASSSPTKSSTKNGIIVKIRRVRQSELSLLNDEAENFMFPKKDDSSGDDTDDDRQTTSESYGGAPGEFSMELPSSEITERGEQRTIAPGSGGRKRMNDSAKVSESSESSPAKKARTPPQVVRSRALQTTTGRRGMSALLSDNAEYYKFQDPGSRLRFPEAPIQPGSVVTTAASVTRRRTSLDDDDAFSQQPQEQLQRRPGRGGRGRGRGRGRRRGMANHQAPPTSVRRGPSSKASKTKTTPTPMSGAKMEAGSTASAATNLQDDLLLARSSPSSPYQHQEQLSACGKTIISYVKGKEDGMGVFNWINFNKRCEEIKPYKFIFERVPSLEPWYETFQRQDEGTEKVYEYFGNTAYRKLPYEMGAMPALRQNCCILNYKPNRLPKAPPSESSSCGGSHSRPGSASGTPGSDLFASPAPVADDKQQQQQSLSLPLKKRKLMQIDNADRPRKSPREHASTLAILSLLSQQQQRKRTLCGGMITIIGSPKKSQQHQSLVQQQQQRNQYSQDVDSALGEELRSSSVDRERKDSGNGGGKIKFDPPVFEQSYVNYKAMCQEWDAFLEEKQSASAADDDELDVSLFSLDSGHVGSEEGSGTGSGTSSGSNGSSSRYISIDHGPLALEDVVRAVDAEPPLSLRQVQRYENVVKKLMQYDRKPRSMSSAIRTKLLDSCSSVTVVGSPSTAPVGGSLLKKRINRTGWPTSKRKIGTRTRQQLKGGTLAPISGVSALEALQVKKEMLDEEEQQRIIDETDSGKQRTANSMDAAASVQGKDERAAKKTAATILLPGGRPLKQEPMTIDEDDEVDEDDEFEDTMVMLEDEDRGKSEEEEQAGEGSRLNATDSTGATKSNRTKEPYPSSKYVTKTTNTMTRVDYGSPIGAATATLASAAAAGSQELAVTRTNETESVVEQASTTATTSVATTTTTTATTEPTAAEPCQANVASSRHQSSRSRTLASSTTIVITEDDDKECDSISSRSIFVSDDCDTTSSTLINICAEDPLSLPADSLVTVDLVDEQPTPPITRNATPVCSREEQVRSPSARIRSKLAKNRRMSISRRLPVSSSVNAKLVLPAAPSPIITKSYQPVVCIEKLSCSTIKTRSSTSRSPVKTYKRSVFTSALISSSSGRPHKRKRRKRTTQQQHKLLVQSAERVTHSSKRAGEQPSSGTVVHRHHPVDEQDDEEEADDDDEEEDDDEDEEEEDEEEEEEEDVEEGEEEEDCEDDDEEDSNEQEEAPQQQRHRHHQQQLSSSSSSSSSSAHRRKTPGQIALQNRPPTPMPLKYSPRKLRKPRGRWYRER